MYINLNTHASVNSGLLLANRIQIKAEISSKGRKLSLIVIINADCELCVGAHLDTLVQSPTNRCRHS